MQTWSFKPEQKEPTLRNMPIGSRPNNFPYRPATPRPQEK